MITRYLTNTRWEKLTIKSITVLSETDKCYFTPGYRPNIENKHLKDTDYHETYSAARTAVVTCAENRVAAAKEELAKAEQNLENARKLPLEVEP